LGIPWNANHKATGRFSLQGEQLNGKSASTPAANSLQSRLVVKPSQPLSELPAPRGIVVGLCEDLTVHCQLQRSRALFNSGGAPVYQPDNSGGAVAKGRR
jgi:hypothetical protein